MAGVFEDQIVDAARNTAPAPSGGGSDRPVISVVMPCLNEEASVAYCVDLALKGIARTGLPGEVVVSDNGSTDNSVAVATAAGARVVHATKRGYGNAYMKGFEEARGDFIVMGDSDSTYDFSQLDKLITPLQDGYEYVLGSRFAGKILPGAMPWMHRYVGNPVLTGILNTFFHLNSSDAHSGMRAFTRSAYERMDLRCEGMEFASEIVMKAARNKLRITEVPITYYPRTGDSKLHSLRDGWRHLRFMLLHAPRYLFLVPGLVFLTLGIIGQIALLPGTLSIGGHALDSHFSVLFTLLSIVGFQIVVFGVFANVYGYTRGVMGADERVYQWVRRRVTLERGLVVGGLVFLAGFAVDAFVLVDWLNSDFGPLNQMKLALLGMTLMVLGVQTAFASFFVSLLSLEQVDSAGTVEAATEQVPAATGVVV